MDVQSWLLFSSIAFIATITPGPAILLATTHSLAYGLKNSIFTILGNISGLFIMSVLSLAGLSAIILSSSTVFSIVKYTGAFYLIYLGIKIWRNGFMPMTTSRYSAKEHANGKKLYLHGVVVALSNPKAIAFTTALFPQFISPEQSLLAQFGVLISTFMFLSFTCIFSYAYAAHTTKNKFLSSTPSYLSKVFGSGFVASGVLLASTTHKHA